MQRGWDFVILVGYVVGAIAGGAAGLVRAILSPSHVFTTRIVRVELRCQSSTEIGLFALLLALSPREVCVALGTRPAVAFIFALDAPGTDELADRMRRLETRILRVCRGRHAMEVT